MSDHNFSLFAFFSTTSTSSVSVRRRGNAATSNESGEWNRDATSRPKRMRRENVFKRRTPKKARWEKWKWVIIVYWRGAFRVQVHMRVLARRIANTSRRCGSPIIRCYECTLFLQIWGGSARTDRKINKHSYQKEFPRKKGEGLSIKQKCVA